MSIDYHAQWLELGRRHAAPYAQPDSEVYWATRYECMPRAELRALQDERVALAYRYLFFRSDFYREKFSRAGLAADSVSGVADLQRVPVTVRGEWLRDQKEHPPWGRFSALGTEGWTDRGWMLFTTSGTSADSPRAFRHTTFDRDMWTWHGARALYAMGVRRGDVAINCFGYGTSVAFWGLHYALNHMGVPVIPGGGSSTERRALFIELFSPTVLLCTPSYAAHLGRSMLASGKDPKQSSVRLLVVAGEPGACIPSTKRRLEELWGAVVHDDFGCTEVAMSPLGYTCAYQAQRPDGLTDTHIMEDAYHVEVVDPDTHRPVPDGCEGVLVVSNLYSEAQPILRYVMGDWVKLTREACPCGRTHCRAVGGLRGRSDDLIKVRGLMFPPAVFEDAIRCQPEVADDFKIELLRERDLDRVRVTVAPSGPLSSDEYPAFGRSVAQRLRGLLGIDVDVVPVPRGTLPVAEFKAKRFFDLRST